MSDTNRDGGKGGRARGRYPKGRQVDERALTEIRALLGDGPRERSMLLEYLHLVQDRYGFLSAAHLVALADEMRLSMSEVYEVASFYAHFDIVKEGGSPPPKTTIRVCDGVACEMAGARSLMQDLKAAELTDVRIVRAPCMGGCGTAPVVRIGDRYDYSANTDSVSTIVEGEDFSPVMPDYIAFDAYRENGGYEILSACKSGRRDVGDVIQSINRSGLRGLGGAGFPVGRKWEFVRAEAKPRLLVLNADEGEPGTFKDRYFLESDPHRVIEGMLIAAWAVEADAAYIYLRDEYPAIQALLAGELARLEAERIGLPGGIHLRRGAGAYICGEESAMLESIEGKRGLPRHRPPYAAEVGLFGRPTLIQNVESVYWIRAILDQGAEWFSGQGVNGGRGLRAYSVSGRVSEPGVKIAPAGITARALIEEHCGGMAAGHEFKAYLPGGASGGILPASLADVPLDFGKLDEYGCVVGSGAIIVLSDQDNIGDVALNLMRFFEDESCGQCTPCRVGTQKAVRIMSNGTWDQPVLEDLAQVMADASICGLGQAACNPINSVLRHFRNDVQKEPGRE